MVHRTIDVTPKLDQIMQKGEEYQQKIKDLVDAKVEIERKLGAHEVVIEGYAETESLQSGLHEHVKPVSNDLTLRETIALTMATVAFSGACVIGFSDIGVSEVTYEIFVPGVEIEEKYNFKSSYCNHPVDFSFGTAVADSERIQQWIDSEIEKNNPQAGSGGMNSGKYPAFSEEEIETLLQLKDNGVPTVWLEPQQRTSLEWMPTHNPSTDYDKKNLVSLRLLLPSWLVHATKELSKK